MITRARILKTSLKQNNKQLTAIIRAYEGIEEAVPKKLIVELQSVLKENQKITCNLGHLINTEVDFAVEMYEN